MARVASGIPNWVWLTAIAGVGYFVYRAATSVTSIAHSATGATADAIAKWWLDLFPNPPAMMVLGSVAFPNGQLIPLSQLTVRTDAAQNVYVSYQGQVYSLSPSDANGNWPATLVTSIPG